MRIFVTGASGLIGRRLCAALVARGDEVVGLTRSVERSRARLSGVTLVEGDVTRDGAWQDEVARADAVVHLAGEPVVGRRWTAARKQALFRSRVDGARRVTEALAREGARARVLVSSSAIGYYGPQGDAALDEDSAPGHDFLGELCVAWEAASKRAETPERRVVQLRTGVVLDPDGGALAMMLPAFRAFVGGPVGSGRQWVSWIHRDDLGGLIRLALDDERVRGPLNGVAPEPVTMQAFAAAVARALDRPSWMKVPAFLARLALGEAAEALLEAPRVVPKRALALGYEFRFPTVDGALAELLARAATA